MLTPYSEKTIYSIIFLFDPSSKCEPSLGFMIRLFTKDKEQERQNAIVEQLSGSFTNSFIDLLCEQINY